ncbi:MAG TPA: serine hydrolase domain-containing protein [Chondromyces sp.]|nr:serine hydrolase domain-containing protein [Chondromyces sp.]
MADRGGPVHTLLERAVRAGQVAGAVAVWGRDEASLRSVRAGCAALRPVAVPAVDETWFDLASLTKPLVTTTLCLLGFRTGALEPTDRIGELLPETRGSEIEDLELASLLTHSSGLPAWLPLYCLAEGEPRRLPERLGRIGLEARPGTRVRYSCVGFVIAAVMLERATGRSLEQLFSEQVLHPLGLEERLGFHPDPGRRPLAGAATAPDAETLLVRELGADPAFIPPVGPGLPDDGNARFLGGAAGNAGLFGSARGVWRLAAEYANPTGALLTAGEAAAATRSHTDGLEQARGYGWQLAATAGCSAGPALPPSAFGHTGFTGVSVWAERGGATYVLLANRVHPAHRNLDLHPLRRRFHQLAKATTPRC